MIFLNVNKQIEKIGYRVVRNGKYELEYEKEEPQGYKHKKVITLRQSGKQSKHGTGDQTMTRLCHHC